MSVQQPGPGHIVPSEGEDVLNHLTMKDETVFIALIFMGIFVPAIFISVFALVCIRRHKENKARNAEMLLRDAQDMAMEDYPYTMRGVTRFTHLKL